MSWSRCHGLVVVVLSLWPRRHCHCDRRHCLHHCQHRLCCRCRHQLLSPLPSPLSSFPVSVMAAQQWRRSDGRSDGREGGGAAMVMAVQQRQWRCSDGLGSTATAMVAQQRLRRNSNGLGSTAMAMAMAAQQWGWQWWWQRSYGGAAMVEAAQRWWWTEAIVEYRIVSYSVFVYQIDILRSFLRRPHTDRFPDDVLKKNRRNRNHDSCIKSTTGVEKTGIRRIPAGICNLGISHFPKNGINCTDLHQMHHLPSLRNSINACDVSLAAAGEKT
jgi:hypothetical protein